MKIDLNNIPTKPWVYFFKDKTWKLLYIWKAKNLKNRISQYFAVGSIWKQEMVAQANSVDFVIVNSENEALILETNLINKHRPPYNNLLKWDNAYIYIKITNEDFPQIVFTRYRQNDWWIYIGPKSFRFELKKLMEVIRLLLKFRGCKATEFKKWKLTTDFFFWLCEWWCIYSQLKLKTLWLANWNWTNQYNSNVKQAISQWFNPKYDYEWAKQEYKKRINMLIDFFKWNSKELEEEILRQINSCIISQNFEYAAKLRDVYMSLKRFVEKQNVVLSEVFDWYFFRLKQIWEYWVYCILYFYQWKLIDIIRFKEKDISAEELIDQFTIEFGEFKIFDDITWYSKNIKISKENTKEICKLMDNFIESIIISSSFEKENLMNELLKWVQEKYSLKNYPYKIECIDISHLSWGWISWWLSCHIGGLGYKKWYRQYKIKSLKSTWQSNYSNDYQSLAEIIQRRFNLNKKFGARKVKSVDEVFEDIIDENIETEENISTKTTNENSHDYPDLFILDWWKWQLWILKEIYDWYPEFKELFHKIDFVSLGKWAARKTAGKVKWEKEKIYKFNEKMEIIEIEMNYDDSDKILIKARDEAHRFANRYRKKQMSMEFK